MEQVKGAGSKVHEAATTKEAKCMKQVKSAGSKVHEARKRFMKQVNFIKQVTNVSISCLVMVVMVV